MINLLSASYGTVSDIEILFTVLAFGGAIFSFFNIIEASRDYGAIKTAKIGNGRRLLAWTQLHAEMARLIVQLIFTSIGIMAMFIPRPPPDQHLPILIIAYTELVTWGLILSTSLLLYKSALGHYMRKHLRNERLERQGEYYEEIHKIEEEAAKVDPLIQPLDVPDDATPDSIPE